MTKEKSILKSPWFYVSLFVLLILFYLVIPRPPTSPGIYDDFAKCLTKAGAIMHGTDWCPHCKNQKAMFGSSFRFVNYVNCDKEKETCLRAGVDGYPTWTIRGKNYAGVQALEKLSALTNCSLKPVKK